jgi:hypothetical protein
VNKKKMNNEGFSLHPSHYFFKDLLFHVLDPAPLLTLRLVCKTWKAAVENDIYWVRHRNRLVQRLPSLNRTFSGSEAPLWRIYTMLMCMGTMRQRRRKERGMPFWAGVLDAIVAAAHRNTPASCIRVQYVKSAATMPAGMRDSEMPAMNISYTNRPNQRITLRYSPTTLAALNNLRTAYGQPTSGTGTSLLTALATLDAETGETADCVTHWSNWCALYGPFMALVRNRTPYYARDEHGFTKSPTSGSFLFFED